MTRHNLRMLIGCLLPIALIFILPLFGVSEGVILFVFVVLMFGCHLLMIGGHGNHGDEHTVRRTEEHHESH